MDWTPVAYIAVLCLFFLGLEYIDAKYRDK